jgi:hypothetical protein
MCAYTCTHTGTSTTLTGTLSAAITRAVVPCDWRPNIRQHKDAHADGAACPRTESYLATRRTVVPTARGTSWPSTRGVDSMRAAVAHRHNVKCPPDSHTVPLFSRWPRSLRRRRREQRPRRRRWPSCSRGRTPRCGSRTCSAAATAVRPRNRRQVRGFYDCSGIVMTWACAWTRSVCCCARGWC